MAELWLGTLVGLSVGVVIGFTFASYFKVRLANEQSVLNNFRKQSVRSGAVSEFIAPGENAEVISSEDGAILSPNRERACQGCKYFGRYVL